MLVQNYLNEKGCARLVEFADATAGKPALVGDIKSSEAVDSRQSPAIRDLKGGGAVGRRQDSAFVAERIDVQSNQDIQTLANSICKHIYRQIVGPYYKVAIEWFEVPHLLRYTAGGSYIAHSDCENWDDAKNCWVKGVDRDYSSIIYLNSDFTGGSLAFPYLNLRLYPQPGMLVTFPSDHRFLHAAEETLTGQRYAFVTWAAAKGRERVMKRATPFIVRL
jgi:predicted 2-oxoglutarate/Fe(II)-dependent dioxygenase YbiX